MAKGFVNSVKIIYVQVGLLFKKLLRKVYISVNCKTLTLILPDLSRILPPDHSAAELGVRALCF